MENENVTPMPQGNPIVPQKESKPMGALIGAIIVIILLIAGGIYVWSTRIQPQITAPENAQTVADNTAALEESATAPDTMIDTLTSQSSSDEVTSIEADLNATDLNSIDKELQSI